MCSSAPASVEAALSEVAGCRTRYRQGEYNTTTIYEGNWINLNAGKAKTEKVGEAWLNTLPRVSLHNAMKHGLYAGMETNDSISILSKGFVRRASFFSYDRA